MKALVITAFIAFTLFANCTKSDSKDDSEPLPDVDLKTRVVGSGLSHVWEMVYGPDQHLWITERSGKISRVNVSSGVVTLLHDIAEVVSTGEGGLLGMAIHPQFDSNPYVYVAYNYGSPYRQKVVRFSYASGGLSSPQVLIDQIPAASIHNGSRLLITQDMKLLITTGDASVPASAQNVGSLSGKILRINLDGSIPADNPTPGSRVWSSGHRNPQGLTAGNGMLYSSEHGPNNDDEINIIRKGGNYGWPNVEGYCDENNEKTFCTTNNVVEPIKAWTPTTATCGLTYYDSDYIPQWKNSLLLVTLKGSKLIQLKLNDSGNQVTGTKDFFQNDYGRLRAICKSPEGKVFIASSNGNNDRIIEIGK